MSRDPATTTTTTTTTKKLFTELTELRREGDEFFWKETARWVKFEETVEEGAERWSKPHVATLSLKSLEDLRKLMTPSNVVLDAEIKTISDLTDLVGTKIRDRLTKEQVDSICKYFGQKTKHQHERFKTLSGDKKLEEKSPIDPDLTPEAKQFKYNRSFMRKVPRGTEGHSVFLGWPPELEKGQSVTLFIRLKSSLLFEGRTEIEIPTKFVSIFFRSEGDAEIEAKQVARCMGALMTDEIFRETAFSSHSASSLISAIDEFKSSSTLLPPASWDPETRVEPPEKSPSQFKRLNSVRLLSEKEEIPTELTKMLEDPLLQPKSAVEEEEERLKEWRDGGLLPSGRPFGGFVGDIKRKLPFYLSDIKDAFNLKCLASFFFIYFACLSSQITFGGIHAEATENWIGTEEGLFAAAICGCFYALTAAQPLTILGCTGPILVFESITYQICQTYDLNYLSFRFWTGTWCSFLLLICTAADLSFLVVFITRFTEECFATLIAIIFMYESFKSLFSLYDLTPFEMHVKYDHLRDHATEDQEIFTSNSTSEIQKIATTTTTMTTTINAENSTVGNLSEIIYVPDVFLFSVLLFLGTFTIAYSLKFFKFSRFFPTRVRSVLSDFSVFVSIIVMTTLDAACDLDTKKLHVPTKFEPTLSTHRGWVVDPMKGIDNKWMILLALIPAILQTILIFMDQTITLVIINRKENKMKKGAGYHLDLLMISLLIFISALLGLPYFVAATVRSMVHVNSLRVESKIQAPGEKPVFLGIKEQRLTACLSHFAIGLSVLMSGVLQMIPMAVLYGIFLYMGVSSLGGIQFFERLLLLLMPLKHQPDRPYLRRVRPCRVHLFTAVQAIGFLMLYLVKHFKETSIVFPVMIVALMGIRKLMDFLFTTEELKALDDPLPALRDIRGGGGGSRGRCYGRGSGGDNDGKRSMTDMNDNEGNVVE